MFKHFKIGYILFSLMVIISCQTKTISNGELDLKIETIELKNQFLEDIYQSDQAIRSQLLSTEFNNKQLKSFWEEASKIDSMNLIKIENYLKQFGYPDTVNYSIKARKAPWYVIQHCTKSDLRAKYYKVLRSAFKNGRISEIDFYLYLQRNYQIKNKEMLGIEYNEDLTFAEKILIFQDTLGYGK